MNKILLLITILLFSTTIFAVTIDTTAKYDTAYGYEGGPVTVSTTFGKIPVPGDYGIFAAVTYKPGENNDGHENLFFRLVNADLERDGKYLYMIYDGMRIKVAKKKWYGWKKLRDIKIKHSIKMGNYPVIKIWMEI